MNYNENDKFYASIDEQHEINVLFKTRKFNMVILTKEEIELINLAFKMKMKKIQEGITKCNTAINSGKYDRNILDVTEKYR